MLKLRDLELPPIFQASGHKSASSRVYIVQHPKYYLSTYIRKENRSLESSNHFRFMCYPGCRYACVSTTSFILIIHQKLVSLAKDIGSA